MGRALRSLIIMIVTIAVIAGIGHMLESPPRILDAITGATLRVDADDDEDAQGTYILGTKNDEISSMVRGVANEKDSASDIAAGKRSGKKRYVIAVNEKEPLIEKYASNIATRCRDESFSVVIGKYSETMLRSRMMAGKCDAFIVPMGFMDMDLLEDGIYELQDVDAEQLTQRTK